MGLSITFLNYKNLLFENFINPQTLKEQLNLKMRLIKNKLSVSWL